MLICVFAQDVRGQITQLHGASQSILGQDRTSEETPLLALLMQQHTSRSHCLCLTDALSISHLASIFAIWAGLEVGAVDSVAQASKMRRSLKNNATAKRRIGDVANSV
jgi:hypothetical protein